MEMDGHHLQSGPTKPITKDGVRRRMSKGTVSNWTGEYGWIAVDGDDRSAFVHVDALTAELVREFRHGLRVRLDVDEGPEGTKARNVELLVNEPNHGKSISSYRDLLSTTPACELRTWDEPTDLWDATSFGFLVDREGSTSMQDLSESDLANVRDALGDPSWAPLDPGSERVKALFRDSMLTVEQVLVFSPQFSGLSVRDDGGTLGWLTLTTEYLFGAYSRGFRGMLREDAYVRLKPDQVFVWRWPLTDIEEISVSRVRKLFRLTDAEIEIKGMRSKLTARDLSVLDKETLPESESKMLSFGMALANCVHAVRGGPEPAWEVKAERGIGSLHSIRFG